MEELQLGERREPAPRSSNLFIDRLATGRRVVLLHVEVPNSHGASSSRSLAEGSFLRGASPSRSAAEDSFELGAGPSRTPAEGSFLRGAGPSRTPAEGSPHARGSPSRTPAEGSPHARGSPSRTLAEGSFDIAETAELVASAGLALAGQVTARRRREHPRWLVGSGKVEEIHGLIEARGADMLVVNNDLSARQQRNLEQALGCRVMGRSELIIHIFAQRARTFEGQLQVELAQLTHAQTLLVGGWSHLERQKGGIGLRGGAGETQLELDQRMLATRIKSVQSRLAGVRKRRSQGQRQRRRSGAQTVALVGYTNAGKSTLFNALATAGVAAEDKLFATLDPTLRRIDVPGAAQVVLADTVGFISHLPHTLIDAFKATLEEVSQADLLIHVMDGAAPRLDQRIADVEAVLEEIGASACARINVLNKCDLPQAGPVPPDALPVSAAKGEGLDALRSRIGLALGVQAPIDVDLPASAGSVRAWLYAVGAVLGETHGSDGGMRLKVRGDERLMARLRRDLAACGHSKFKVTRCA